MPSPRDIAEAMAAHLTQQGIPTTVFGGGPVEGCGYPRCVQKREAEEAATKPEAEAEDCGPDVEDMAEEIRPADEASYHLSELANQLDVGVEVTITMKRHYRVDHANPGGGES